MKKSKYKERRVRNAALVARGANPPHKGNAPWWVTRYACEGSGVNPYLEGPYHGSQSRHESTEPRT